MEQDFADGWYWAVVDGSREAEIVRRISGRWYDFGDDPGPLGDSLIKVVAGPLKPPGGDDAPKPPPGYVAIRRQRYDDWKAEGVELNAQIKRLHEANNALVERARRAEQRNREAASIIAVLGNALFAQATKLGVTDVEFDRMFAEFARAAKAVEDRQS